MGVTPRLLIGLLIVGLGSPAVQAQSPVEGYIAGAGGRWSNRFASGGLAGVAGGADIAVTRQVAAEMDVALLAASGGLLVALAPGVKVRFRELTTHAASPFLVGGYSFLQFFEGSRHAFHVGGGVDYAFSDRRALRIEVRDAIRRDFPSHYLSIRVGVTFR